MKVPEGAAGAGEPDLGRLTDGEESEGLGDRAGLTPGAVRAGARGRTGAPARMRRYSARR
ncbi:hypothetical protein GCM10007977_057460 [Dactylosporangium sucinum]|uniref:Uncharacterized protein n=1 Tax=Dactylosporangium sucinum TaxID=1424081 RepID=A0A917X0S2_9ACTN|nr:hypothetical protein GCM10007977_057460 [Dactylosporangium sucinum]